MNMIEVGDRMINADTIAYARRDALMEDGVWSGERDVLIVYFAGGAPTLTLPWNDGGQAFLVALRKLTHERERQERGRVTRGRIGPDD